MGYNYIIDANGGGDFRTIQEAVDDAGRFWPRLRRFFRRARAYVRPGVYTGFEVDVSVIEIHAGQEGVVFEDCTFIDPSVKGDSSIIESG